MLNSAGSEVRQIEGEDGEDVATDSDSADDLWNVDGDMSAEEVTAALTEEKRRKKVRAIFLVFLDGCQVNSCRPN